MPLATLIQAANGKAAYITTQNIPARALAERLGLFTLLLQKCIQLEDHITNIALLARRIEVESTYAYIYHSPSREVSCPLKLNVKML